MTVRTRMAPSPTGEIHVGSLATLLKSYALARKHHGQFILRIEDTDQTREVPGAIDRMMAVIKAYGLSWDEGPDVGGPHGPYIQSERLDIYQDHARQLIEQDQAYYCFCSRERLESVRNQQIANKQQPRYDGHCRHLSSDEVQEKLRAGEPYVIRLKVPPDKKVTFTDVLRGEITFDSNDVDDQVLLKSDGFPTYHLAVVVDDHLMKISHILRGEEWLSSAPKHILLYQAFNWDIPVLAHIPVFLSPDGKGKMSKRKGDVSAQSFLDRGYLPEALLNFFMILGWVPADQRELLTLDEYIAEFDLAHLSAKSVVFDVKKLDWLNGVYIRKLSNEHLLKRLEAFIPSQFDKAKVAELLPLVKERLVTLADIEALTHYFFEDIEVDSAQLLKRADSPAQVIEQISTTITVLEKIDNWSVAVLEETLRTVQAQHAWQPKQYFMMLRTALTGEQATPPLFDTIKALGLETTVQRLRDAQAQLESA